MLRSSINRKLSQTLAGNHLLPDNDFSEWIRIVNKVAQQVEMSERYFQGQRSQHRSDFKPNMDSALEIPPNKYREESHDYEVDPSRGDKNRVGNLDGAGDTIMGGINTSGVAKGERRRALWKNKAKIDKLRLEGKCFRCERRGCITRNCPLFSANRPKSNSTNVNMTELPDISPSLYRLDEVDSVNGEDSEN